MDMNKNHVIRMMNQAGMVQRTNSGDLVGMYTLNQMAEVLALHDNVAHPSPAVPMTNVDAELQTAKEEIEYLKQQVEKSNQQGILAAQERDINYHNWQTSQHEVGVATALYETTLAERNKINGQWYESAAKLKTTTAQHNNLITAARLLQQERDAAILERDELRGSFGNLEYSFGQNAIAHSNCLREIEVLKSQLADTKAAWDDACKLKGEMAANYRAAHGEMTRQEKRAMEAEVKLRITGELANFLSFTLNAHGYEIKTVDGAVTVQAKPAA